MKLRTRALAATTVGAVALSTAVAVAPAATAAPNTRTAAAARWLDSQLTNGLVRNTQYDFDDYGLTLDTYFALRDLGERPAIQAKVITAVSAAVDAYVTGGTSGDVYAGSAAKLLTAVIASRGTPANVGGTSLLEVLESRIAVAGDEVGRATDDATGYDVNWMPAPSIRVDYSNAIGQSWVVRALAGADSELLESATTYLLRQQCATGQFRGNLYAAGTVGATCDDDEGNVMSNDATAFGITALLASQAAGVAGLDDDIADAADWLVSQQATNGSIEDEGTANTNSTGLAATALAGAGESAAAVKAATWVAAHQVTDATGGKLTNQGGAIAYDAAALAAGKTDGIETTARDQWIRASAQAAASLALLEPWSGTARVGTLPTFVAAGSTVTVSVSGLEPGWKATASVSGGGTATAAGSSSGAARFSLRVPAGTATRTITIRNVAGQQVAASSVRVLAKKKFAVKTAKAKVKRTKVQKVTVRGLAAKEPVRIYLRGKLVKKGTASASGTYVHRFKVGKKTGKARVVVRGAFSNRYGTKTFKVVK